MTNNVYGELLVCYNKDWYCENGSFHTDCITHIQGIHATIIITIIMIDSIVCIIMCCIQAAKLRRHIVGRRILAGRFQRTANFGNERLRNMVSGTSGFTYRRGRIENLESGSMEHCGEEQSASGCVDVGYTFFYINISTNKIIFIHWLSDDAKNGHRKLAQICSSASFLKSL